MKTTFTFLFLSFFCVMIAHAQLTSTNLPIVIVTSASTLTDIQQQGTIKIIDNASGTNTPSDAPAYNGMIGIKYRGTNNGTKNSYSIETWSSPTVSLDTSLLNLPSENDWVLMSSYTDRSLIRSVLSFKLHENMGRWAPRMRYCELIVNNQYVGVYLFGEKIKRDLNRVNVTKMTTTDNLYPQVSGGYILSLDNTTGSGWASQYAPPYAVSGQKINFLYHTPDSATITVQQKSYIKSYVDSFENTLKASYYQDTVIGWSAFASANSFIDFMIINEVCKDYNAYRMNMYMHKDKSSKLKVSPLWNNDLAWRNTATCKANVDTGWAYNIGIACDTAVNLPPFWWSRIASDIYFMKDLKCKYTSHRSVGGILDTANIFHIIDSVSSKLNANGAVTRNFTQWPIWGVSLVNEPLPLATNYAQEVANLKTFIKARLAWLDTKWILSSCLTPSGINDLHANNNIEVYPNPATTSIEVRCQMLDSRDKTIEMYNCIGECVYYSTYNFQHSTFKIDVSKLSSGVYYLKIGNQTKKVVVE